MVLVITNRSVTWVIPCFWGVALRDPGYIFTDWIRRLFAHKVPSRYIFDDFNAQKQPFLPTKQNGDGCAFLARQFTGKYLIIQKFRV